MYIILLIMEDIIQIKKEIAAKAKILYLKRKAEGKTKKTIPIELQKRRGRTKKEPTLIILSEDDITLKILKPRGRKPNEHLTELLIIPTYIQNKLNKINKDRSKNITIIEDIEALIT